MAALSGLAGQQNAFAIAFGEMKTRKQMQDNMLRQATIDNLIAYLEQSYQKQHAERAAKTARQQAMTAKAATTVATFGFGALLSPGIDEAYKPSGGLDNAVWPNGPGASNSGDFFGSVGGNTYA